MSVRRFSTLVASLSLVSCSATGGDTDYPGGDKADELSICQGAALDGDDVCRLEDGTFAPERCCDAAFGEDGTYDDGSGIGCIFGDHLVTMARMVDLDVSGPMTIDATTTLDGIVLEQVLDLSFDGAKTLEEMLDETDDGEMDLLRVRDVAHRRNFNMYIWSAGDNTVGRIYYSQSMRIAAEIGDGSIGQCDAGYSNYDALPYFYTN
jgi:hypothetical protein